MVCRTGESAVIAAHCAVIARLDRAIQ